ncbi:hypothetical protein [Amycolatopsis sp. WQ 127309]|uniref:hypothetical protein n=1 Tax=Amycolatopsis sp. WQ 127309 TaxID=2932773 RepID=UPI001FF385D0|nr:hypothetical protein [Amycolatopsis sp. WQ 127309]UOZ07033.1 hypothetical protein MUY22_01690 [Amycolatopsis sp. WQ 127309]
MEPPQSRGHAEIDSHTLEELAFQASLAVDAAGAFLQNLQNSAHDPGLSAPLTGTDVVHDPSLSTGSEHATHDAAMSLPVPGSAHDSAFVPHDVAHDPGAPHLDAGHLFH